MSMKAHYDVIVIGGGPSGMMAAGRAGERGLSVLLIDKNPVLGKKLSITGGGRCNITNAEYDIHTLLSHYGDAKQFLYAPFARFGVKDTFTFFESRGLPIVIEERKRAFPKTMKATDVTKCMEAFVKKHGVTVLTDTPVLGFLTKGNQVIGIHTKQGTFTATSYIVACGGKSHPETGSTGEGISWLSTLGHTTHTANPNLVPLTVLDTWVKKMQGVKLTNVKATFIGNGKKIVRKGDILCTHFGFTGPTILNTAKEVKALLDRGSVTVSINLFPEYDEGTLRERLNTLLTTHENKYLENALKEWFPGALISVLMTRLHITEKTLKSHSVPREVRHALVRLSMGVEATITGTMGYDWAVVSDGGVDLTEIDTKTMQSKIHKNLYVVGDALHISRPSGGYSLQLAWTTGYVAGSFA